MLLVTRTFWWKSVNLWRRTATLPPSTPHPVFWAITFWTSQHVRTYHRRRGRRSMNLVPVWGSPCGPISLCSRSLARCFTGLLLLCVSFWPFGGGGGLPEKGFKSTSVRVNVNAQVEWHMDANSLGPSLTLSVGSFTGGGFVLRGLPPHPSSWPGRVLLEEAPPHGGAFRGCPGVLHAVLSPTGRGHCAGVCCFVFRLGFRLVALRVVLNKKLADRTYAW